MGNKLLQNLTAIGFISDPKVHRNKVNHSDPFWGSNLTVVMLPFKKCQENNTFDVATLTIQLELEPGSNIGFFQRKNDITDMYFILSFQDVD